MSVAVTPAIEFFSTSTVLTSQRENAAGARISGWHGNAKIVLSPFGQMGAIGIAAGVSATMLATGRLGKNPVLSRNSEHHRPWRRVLGEPCRPARVI